MEQPQRRVAKVDAGDGSMRMLQLEPGQLSLEGVRRACQGAWGGHALRS